MIQLMKRKQGIGEDVGEGMRGSHVTAPRGLSLIVKNEVIVMQHLTLLKLYISLTRRAPAHV